jgi:ABC-type glycerol-3-phosphate transport system permease component
MKRTLRYLLLVAVLLLCIGPFLWQLSTSLKGVGEDIYSNPPRLFPAEPTVTNYTRVADVVPVWRFAFNSLLVAVANVLLNCIGAAMAGYALARLRFRGRRAALGAFVLSLLVPGEAIMISLFLMMRSLSLDDTLVAVVLPGAVAALNVLLMRNAFARQSRAVEEAALIDGATTWQRFSRIAVPSAGGTLAVVAILSFMFSWDDFLWPLIVLRNPENYTLTIGLNYLQGTFASDQRLVAAGTIIAVAPLLALFICLQRYFFRGAGEGAVKG